MGNLKLYNLLRCAVGVKQGITVLKRKEKGKERTHPDILVIFQRQDTCRQLPRAPVLLQAAERRLRRPSRGGLLHVCSATPLGTPGLSCHQHRRDSGQSESRKSSTPLQVSFPCFGKVPPLSRESLCSCLCA